MVINNGDKLVVKKTVAEFLKEGDIAKVIDINNDIISFAFGEDFVHMGIMTAKECKEHFEKVVEKAKAPTVTYKDVQSIIDNSEFEIFTVFDKCTIVACKLPNGFVIVESAACVSPENYSKEVGTEICIDKITDKIWELEGYKLQNEVHEEAHTCDCCECENVKEGIEVNGSSIYSGILTKLYNDIKEMFPTNFDKEMFPTNFDDEEEEEFDECLDTDLDCYDCTDYTCRFNPENNLRAT